MDSLKKEMTQNLEELCNFHNIKNTDRKTRRVLHVAHEVRTT